MKVLALSVFIIILGVVLWNPLGSRGQKVLDEPTPVERGVTTAERREFSREFRGIYGDILLKTLPELIAESEPRKEFISRIHYEPPYFMGSAPESASAFLSKNTCKADAVVIARPTKKTAHLTDDERFIYTQYELTIEETVKDNSKAAITAGIKIQMARPGGFIRLDGQNVRFVDENVPQLELEQSYLLFLRFVPNARGYMVADYDADFSLAGAYAKSIGKPGGVPAEIKQSQISRLYLVSEVKNLATAGCGKQKPEVKL